MRFQIEWHGIATLKCSDCKTYVYTIPEGKLQTYDAGDGRQLPALRDGIDPPCEICPRGGPQNEERLTLSPEGWQAYRLWQKLQATAGAYRLHPKVASCPMFAEAMATVADTVRIAEASLKMRAMKNADAEHVE